MEFRFSKKHLFSALAFFFAISSGCSAPKVSSELNNLSHSHRDLNASINLTNSNVSNLPEFVNWISIIGLRRFDWDGNDLRIQTNAEKPIHLFAELFQNRMKYFDGYTKNNDCSTDYHFRIASIVGSIVSFEFEKGSVCGPGSFLSWGFRSIDLEDEGEYSFLLSDDSPRLIEKNSLNKSIALTKMFSDEEILKALLDNDRVAKWISALIESNKTDRKPENLSELNMLIKEHAYESFGSFYPDSRYLEGFSFQNVNDEMVEVWINLTPDSRASQALQDHLVIVLPVNSELRAPLQFAGSQVQGFLGKDARRLTGTGYTHFE